MEVNNVQILLIGVTFDFKHVSKMIGNVLKKKFQDTNYGSFGPFVAGNSRSTGLESRPRSSVQCLLWYSHHNIFY